MKDPILEFEELDMRLNEVLGGIFKKIGSSLFPKMSAGIDVKKTTDYYGNPSKQYTYQGSPLQKRVSGTIARNKEMQKIKDKCKQIGSEGPNELFELQDNGISAKFGKSKNLVKDTRGLEISKDELVCYDLKKDKFGIAWLFSDDAIFEAKRIWGKPMKIYFEGTWKAGEFKGIMTSHSNLEGGTIVPPGRMQYSGQKQNTKTGNFKLPVSNLGIKTIVNKKSFNVSAIVIKIDDENELKRFNAIRNDFYTNAFMSKVSAFKKLVQNHIIDGYGEFPALNYLFANKQGVNYKNLTEPQKALMKYFSDIKMVIVDNIKDAGTQKKFIDWLKANIFGQPEVEPTAKKVVAKQPIKQKLAEFVSECLKTA